MALFLARNDVVVGSKDRRGGTPPDYATRNGHSKAAALLQAAMQTKSETIEPLSKG